MTRVDTVCLWVALTSAALSVFSYETSIAYDRPVHTFVTALGVAVFALVSVANTVPALFATSSAADLSWSLALNDGAKTPPDNAKRHHFRIRLLVLAAAVAAITTRLKVCRQITKATECTLNGVEV